MAYDYVVIGGGPSGVTLAYALALTNRSVLLLEGTSSLGGNWKTDWVDNTYLSEHSPKVLFSTNQLFFGMLRAFGIRADTTSVYGSYVDTQFKMYKRILEPMSFREMYHSIQAFSHYIFSPSTFDYYQSVDEWMRSKAFAKEGYRSIKVLCITLATTPDKLCMGSLLESIVRISGSSMVQLKRPNEWVQRVESIFASIPNLDVRYRCYVECIDDKTGCVTSSDHKLAYGKNIVSCIPLRGFYKIIRNSSIALQGNWFDTLMEFQEYVDNSTYTGIGIQLHFNRPMDTLDQKWCWSCYNDWTIIVTQKENTNIEISKDPSIQSVWSCVIVDLDATSKRLRKTVHECTMAEIVDELMFQLSTEFNTQITPCKITVHSGVKKENGKWVSPNSSYSNSMGTLPFQGKRVTNVFTIGPHTVSRIATVETAIESAIHFCTFKGIKHPFKRSGRTLSQHILWIAILCTLMYGAVVAIRML